MPDPTPAMSMAAFVIWILKSPSDEKREDVSPVAIIVIAAFVKAVVPTVPVPAVVSVKVIGSPASDACVIVRVTGTLRGLLPAPELVTVIEPL